jgi:hypothetical protein
MGTDIHAFAEVRRDGLWSKVENAFPRPEINQYPGHEMWDRLFYWRHYGLFGFLADVRNYAKVPTIGPPRGFPDDASAELNAMWQEEGAWTETHSASWLTLAELQAFDYDEVFIDEDVASEREEDALRTVREFLPDIYFRDLEILSGLGKPEDVRVVFWFDN